MQRPLAFVSRNYLPKYSIILQTSSFNPDLNSYRQPTALLGYLNVLDKEYSGRFNNISVIIYIDRIHARLHELQIELVSFGIGEWVPPACFLCVAKVFSVTNAASVAR
jgi:hypothetical protein